MSFATYLFFKWVFSTFYAVYLPFLKCTTLKTNSSAKIATQAVCANVIHNNCVKVIFERETLQQLRSYQVQFVSLRTFEIFFILHLLKALKSHKGTYFTMLPEFLDWGERNIANFRFKRTLKLNVKLSFQTNSMEGLRTFIGTLIFFDLDPTYTFGTERFPTRSFALHHLMMKLIANTALKLLE